jgi:hypothetical protein
MIEMFACNCPKAIIMGTTLAIKGFVRVNIWNVLSTGCVRKPLVIL